MQTHRVHRRQHWVAAVTILILLVSVAVKAIAGEQSFSAADQQALRQVHQAIMGAQNKDNGSVLNQILPFNQASVSQWLALQKKAPSYSEASDDLAFVLAFYGIDTEQNLKVMLMPSARSDYERDHLNAPKVKLAKGQENYFFLNQQEIPIRLTFIYLKNHSLTALKSLLDYGGDGVVGEIQTGELENIWPQNAAALLKTANANPLRVDALEMMLLFYKEDASPQSWHNGLEMLEKYARDPDAQIATAAKSLRVYANTLSSSH